MYSSQKIILIWAFIAFVTSANVWFARQLGRKHRFYIQVVSYCFSLSFTVVIFVSTWANHIGVIDAQGMPHGKLGEVITHALDFTLDLNGEIVLVLALLALLIVPQLLSYLISGVFGCAPDLLFFRQGSVFALWTLVKSFSAASGVLMALGVVGYFYKWPKYDLLAMSLFILTSKLLALSSLVALLVYADFMTAFTSGRNPFLSIARKAHTWATRKP